MVSKIAPHVAAATRKVVTARPVSKPQIGATTSIECRRLNTRGVCRLAPTGQYVPAFLAHMSVTANATKPAAAMARLRGNGNSWICAVSPRRNDRKNVVVAPTTNPVTNKAVI
jgi:hypothetical protein